MFHIGLDVHWKTTSVCILNENGQIVKEKEIKGYLNKTIEFLKVFCKDKAPAQVVFEATGHYGFIHDSLKSIKAVKRIVMAHPGHVRLIFRSKQKNDRMDAKKLAKLLYLDEVPAAYIPSVENRHWRELIEFRQALVSRVVRCKNTLRALLRRGGVAAPREFSLWTIRGLAWLESLDLDEASDFQRIIQVDELKMQMRHLSIITGKLDEMGKRNPGVSLLRTIPGIGPRIAEAVVAYVADPHRFGKTNSIGAYFGLIPSQNASAGKNRLGHITKQGPAAVRKLLCEGAWQVIRRCPDMSHKFEKVCHGRKDRRKIALVATARHLSCVMVSMLKSGEVYRGAA